MSALFSPFDLGRVRLSDHIALATAFLADPRWVWRAADTLGATIAYPPQYARAKGARKPA